MADYLEIRHERLYLKVPGTDKVRKTAEGRFKRLTAAGWKETDRKVETDYVLVRLERSGHRPPMTRIPKAAPLQPRTRRDSGPGGPGGRGGPGGGRRGGPGGPPGGGNAPAQAPAPAPAP
jgi:hypothetical protein